MAPTDTTTSPAERGTAGTRWDRVGPDHQLPPADPVTPGSGRTAIGMLLRDLGNDIQALVKQEIHLARMEVTRTAKTLARDSVWMGVGAAIAAVGGLVLVVALALGLGALLDSYWLGTLITGLLLVLVGGLFVWRGLRDLRKQELVPTRTISTLREDADWAREEVRDFKQGLKE